ncbi:hypothetical protein ID866_9672 [Astraeus odoratus]|nr:hypothetical protein ID866_9672 [Astraeus odoratus]
MVQSNGQKMQWYYMLMEGLVGQQQLLISRLVKMEGAEGTLGEELKGALEDEPGNGLGAEDDMGEEAQKRDKGKGKEKALKITRCISLCLVDRTMFSIIVSSNMILECSQMGQGGGETRIQTE